MPFDGTAVSSTKVRLIAIGPDLLAFGSTPTGGELAARRPIPAWHNCRRPETLGDTLVVLARARELLRDEKQWCRGAFARGWRDIPVPVGSTMARRHCVLGAVRRAGRQLGIPVDDACIALEWQIGRPVQDWNDDLGRTHAEVLALFDATILGLRQPIV